MLNSSPTIAELANAMSLFNAEFKGINPDSANPFFKSNYISLDAIVGQRGLLAKFGLVAFQSAATSEDGLTTRVVTRLVHKKGEWIESEPMCIKPVKADPQSMGAAITYAKRYQLGAMLGIAETFDDDGNLANGNPQQGQNRPTNQGGAPAVSHLTPEQGARITELIKAKGLTRDNAIAICQRVTGKTTTADLTQKEGDLLIAEYSKL